MESKENRQDLNVDSTVIPVKMLFGGETAELFMRRQPFPHCRVTQFVRDNVYIEKLEQSLLKLNYLKKDNDLFKFSQTRSLENSKVGSIRRFKEHLLKLKDGIEQMFKVKLNESIDMFAAQYDYTSTLLCHDDELEGRRFAYIYYLVPEDWTADDGGGLSLFNRHPETNQPADISHTITPQRDSILFFEVTSASFHQVSEVLSENKTRLSLTGWFHGEPAERDIIIPDSPPLYTTPCEIDEDKFYKSINPTYINTETQLSVKEQFGDESEMTLNDFITSEIYTQLCGDLQSDSIVWKKRGPPNKRRYSVADVQSLPQSLQDCVSLLTSDAMLLTLSNLTGLKLHSLAQVSDDEESENEEPDTKKLKPTIKKTETNEQTLVCSSSQNSNVVSSTDETSSNCLARVNIEVRKFEHGDYTLLHDCDSEQGQNYALDAFLYLNATGWSPDMGGFVTYVAKGDEDTLLQVEPNDNSLSLVYRDEDTLRFIKHFNHRFTKRNIQHKPLYCIALVFQKL